MVVDAIKSSRRKKQGLKKPFNRNLSTSEDYMDSGELSIDGNELNMKNEDAISFLDNAKIRFGNLNLNF